MLGVCQRAPEEITSFLRKEQTKKKNTHMTTLLSVRSPRHQRSKELVSFWRGKATMLDARLEL